MEIIQAIYITTDEEYAEALQRSLACLSKGILMDIVSPSNGRVESERKDLIISDIPVKGDLPVIYMTEKFSQRRSNPEKREFCAYKYGGLTHIAGMMDMAYCEYTGRQLFVQGKRDVTFTGFLSSQGGAGSSTLAFAFGGELVRSYKKRVLCISLEEYESTENFVLNAGERTGQYAVDDYVYYALSDRNNICSCVENFLGKSGDGVEAFNGSRGRNPLHTLTETQFARVMDTVLSHERFDHVIFDMGTSFSGPAEYALRLCHKICRVSEFDRTEKRNLLAKAEKEILQSSDGIETVKVINKYYPIEVIFTDEEGNEEKRTAARPEGYVIDFDRESFGLADGVEFFYHNGAFWTGVRKLTEALSRRQ